MHHALAGDDLLGCLDRMKQYSSVAASYCGEAAAEIRALSAHASTLLDLLNKAAHYIPHNGSGVDCKGCELQIQIRAAANHAEALHIVRTINHMASDTQLAPTPGTNVAKAFTARAESVDCPKCGLTNHNLLGDPRGKEGDCDGCDQRFYIAVDAEAVIE